MTYALDTFFGPMSGLPDPERDRQFYDGVPRRRLAAWFVDAGVVLALGVPTALIFGLMTLGVGLLAFPLVLIGVSVLYRTATLASGSATWGMRLMGIELRKNDGSRLDGLTAFLHTAIYAACFGTVGTQMLSVLGMVATRYGQGVPDLVLRTAMINRPAI
jgi:uncharacterized RDD family membrane protein YckC